MNPVKHLTDNQKNALNTLIASVKTSGLNKITKIMEKRKKKFADYENSLSLFQRCTLTLGHKVTFIRPILKRIFPSLFDDYANKTFLKNLDMTAFKTDRERLNNTTTLEQNFNNKEIRDWTYYWCEDKITANKHFTQFEQDSATPLPLLVEDAPPCVAPTPPPSASQVIDNLVRDLQEALGENCEAFSFPTVSESDGDENTNNSPLRILSDEEIDTSIESHKQQLAQQKKDDEAKTRVLIQQAVQKRSQENRAYFASQPQQTPQSSMPRPPATMPDGDLLTYYNFDSDLWFEEIQRRKHERSRPRSVSSASTESAHSADSAHSDESTSLSVKATQIGDDFDAAFTQVAETATKALQQAAAAAEEASIKAVEQATQTANRVKTAGTTLLGWVLGTPKTSLLVFGLMSLFAL